MREFPLDGDETIVEFTSNALEDVSSEIPREKRERVLDKLIEVAESPKPERYVDYFRGCEKLGKIYIDGELRTICCLVTRLPGYEPERDGPGVRREAPFRAATRRVRIRPALRSLRSLMRGTGYELIPVFAITEHDYSRLQDHDRKAVSAVERLSDLETEPEVSDYVEGRPNAFDADDLRTLRGELVDG